jgi:hypothetical protein
MNKSRRLRWAGHTSIPRMEEGRSTFKIVRNKSTGKRYLRKPRRSLDGNIRMNIKEIGVNTRNLFDWAQVTNYWSLCE